MFAASFFLITRYEELTDTLRDEHDRFLPSHSIAYKYGFLDEPVIDQWALLLKKKILEKYPGTTFTDRKFNFISTIDVDQAFAYKNREMFRHLGSMVRCILNLDFSELTRQLAVYSNTSKDPFDTFDYIEEIHNKYKITPNIFILLGRYGRYDKNNPVSNHEFAELIRYLSQFAEIGFHPSYTSNFDFIQFKNELKNLARISNKWIKISRQHFLKLKLPDTYYNLLKIGITQDFSMGYARECGCRAGTCTPFKYFDLYKNEVTQMTVYPFQVMDRSLQKYLALSPNDAIKKIETIISKIKDVNGTFVSLWHNDALGNYKEWRGWKNVFKKMFEIIYA